MIAKQIIEQIMDEYSLQVERKLKEFFKREERPAREYHEFIAALAKNGEEYVLRKGKRIASFSSLLTYKGYTGKVGENFLDFCASIELFRHSILIHDDLVDQDSMRRGGKAFHRLYNYDDRFGEGVAIFYGNILFAKAIEIILGLNFEKAKIERVVELFANCYAEINESQVLDLLFEYKLPIYEEWAVMARKRAASLFKLSLMSGAILGGAPVKDYPFINEAALSIGYAFDIQDDIIGTFASEEQYGRPTHGDIIMGKKPLHIVYAFELARDRELERLKEIFEKGKIEKEQVEEIKNIVRSCGALEKAKQVSREYSRNAIEAIDKTSMNKESKELFHSLIDYVSESLDWYK
ncbi:MAG: polyprenyl synthetase family protein [Methanocellales archaeon]